eukprot:scaffold1202_cov110-Isochrysis_galbana.AAC.2
MTDPPIDHTQAREQDAPGTHDGRRSGARVGGRSTRPSHPPQPCMCIPDMIGRAPGGKSVSSHSPASASASNI